MSTKKLSISKYEREFLSKPGVMKKLNSMASDYGVHVGEIITALRKENSKFDPGTVNAAGAVGLIQFYRDKSSSKEDNIKTINGKKYKLNDFPSMTILEQLDIADQYFQENFVKAGGQPGEIYNSIAYPKTMGKGNEYMVNDDPDSLIQKRNAPWVQNDTITRGSIADYGGWEHAQSVGYRDFYDNLSKELIGAASPKKDYAGFQKGYEPSDTPLADQEEQDLMDDGRSAFSTKRATDYNPTIYSDSSNVLDEIVLMDDNPNVTLKNSPLLPKPKRDLAKEIEDAKHKPEYRAVDELIRLPKREGGVKEVLNDLTAGNNSLRKTTTQASPETEYEDPALPEKVRQNLSHLLLKGKEFLLKGKKDPNIPQKSLGGDIFQGATSGFSLGSKTKNPLVTGLATVGGGIMAAVNYKKQQEEALQAEIEADDLFDSQALTAAKQNSKTVLSSYPSQGVESAGYFQAGKGGKIPQFNHGGKHDPPKSHADKARQFRAMRPLEGENYSRDFSQPSNTQSTHLGTTYEADGRYYATPSITNNRAPYASSVYHPQSFREAMDAGEGIPFDTQKEASEFAEGNWKLPKYPRPVYNAGGKIPNSNIEYQAEGGEVIEHNPFSLPGTDQHGEVNPIASNISKIQGDKHSAPSGGVGMEGGERIFSDQLYVDDSIYQSLKNI